MLTWVRSPESISFGEQRTETRAAPTNSSTPPPPPPPHPKATKQSIEVAESINFDREIIEPLKISMVGLYKSSGPCASPILPHIWVELVTDNILFLLA